MIDFLNFKINVWEPEAINACDIEKCNIELEKTDALEYLAIFKIWPYIDSIYTKRGDDKKIQIQKRFVFHEGYAWNFKDENFFVEHCLNNPRLGFTITAPNSIYQMYSEAYPDWKLKRYYTRSLILLDHIYHCMRQGTGKEILYKAGLDYLAENLDSIDELNLLSTKPTDIYEGVPMRVLRALNSNEGAMLLASTSYRKYLIDLNIKFPQTFDEVMSNSQCAYLKYLIDGDLTVGETGRLYKARRLNLLGMWSKSLFKLFIWKENLNQKAIDEAKAIAKIDPIYANYVKTIDFESNADNYSSMIKLSSYLLYNRSNFDAAIRRSNRKRRYDWQERDNGYVVRYPQTINDFCREAIFMSSCLLTYLDAYINNATTILFLRNEMDVNKPFITLEIYEKQLMQAYHRFNSDCTEEEARWICDYCARHGISSDSFHFNKEIDQLF